MDGARLAIGLGEVTNGNHGGALPNLHDAVGDALESFEDGGVMSGHQQARIGGERFRSILRFEVAARIERLRDGDMLVEVFVKIDVVRGKDSRTAGQLYRAELRFTRVLAPDVATDARLHLLVVAFDELQASGRVDPEERQ